MMTPRFLAREGKGGGHTPGQSGSQSPGAGERWRGPEGPGRQGEWHGEREGRAKNWLCGSVLYLQHGKQALEQKKGSLCFC